MSSYKVKPGIFAQALLGILNVWRNNSMDGVKNVANVASSGDGFAISVNPTKNVKIVPITPAVQHGEGPMWHPQEQMLYYVNTFQAELLRWNPSTKQVTTHKLETDSVGFFLAVKDSPHTFIVAQDRWLNKYFWIADTNNTAVQQQELLFVEPDKPQNQFNDGKVDSKGRIWGGTLKRLPDLEVEDHGGSLYFIKGNDVSHPEEKVRNVSISNGLAWSKDNKYMFYIDSTTRYVTRYNFELESGKISNPCIVFDLKNHPQFDGIPDGMTIDTDDNLWVALFGGKHILHVNPKDGSLVQAIEMPASYVTSVAFGGENLNILYATTSHVKLTEEDRQREPLAGCVFAIYNLGVKGFPANEFIQL